MSIRCFTRLGTTTHSCARAGIRAPVVTMLSGCRGLYAIPHGQAASSMSFAGAHP
jgi:hypothetical protein